MSGYEINANFAVQNNENMGSIFVIQGVLIYMYAFDHNPPHIHVRSGNGDFTITLKDRIVEGRAKAKTIQIVNDFIDVDIDDVVEDVVDAVVSNALRNGKNAFGTKRNIRTNRNTSYGRVQSKSVPDSTDFSDKIDNPGIAVTTDSSYIKH